MSQLNYGAIFNAHQAFLKTKVHPYSTPAMPQPVANGPEHNMMIHAVAMAKNKDGETHGTMVIRALTEHLKRVTPDVNSLHKNGATPSLAPQPNIATQQ